MNKQINKLPGLSINQELVTVAGYKEGASMAMNLHITYSKVIKGAALFEGSLPDFFLWLKENAMEGGVFEIDEQNQEEIDTLFTKHKDMIKKYGVTNYYKVKKNLSNATLAASEFKKFLNNYC